jgi:hypothetical protein
VRSPWHEAPRRRAQWFALIALVTLAHVGFGVQVVASVIGWDGGATPLPRRIDVDLVKELAPTEAPPEAMAPPAEVAPPPLAVRPRRAASAPTPAPASAPVEVADAASSPEAAASAPEVDAVATDASASAAAAAASAASAPALRPVVALPFGGGGAVSGPPVVPMATSDLGTPGAAPPIGPTAPAPPTPAASAALPSGTGRFEWPPSTRLTYALGGYFRGDLHGSAQVEWRRDGAHYQVEVSTDLLIASTRSVSDGHIGADGLAPESYDEVVHLGPSTRLQHVRLDPDIIQLTTGKEVPRPPRVQDAASQFVQFIYLFSVHPEWLEPGNVIEMPLALPKRVGTWLYDVHEPETLYLPFGNVEAIRLSPRPESLRPNEIAVEMWIVPTLQYLPAQVQMTQGESRILLTLDHRPLQAAAAGAAASKPPSR